MLSERPDTFNDENTVTRRFFASLEISRDDIISVMPRGEGQSPEQITFIPRTREILHTAITQAKMGGERNVTVMHLLTAVVNNNSGNFNALLESKGKLLQMQREF